MNRLIAKFLIGFFTIVFFSVSQAAEQKKLNVLFIAVDDLRPELGCYGAPIIKTPNIDALAKQGIIFNRAYCQEATCSPSRTSLLTGLRPDSTKVWDLETFFRKNVPNVITLPQYFKQSGYFTQSIGKIFHIGLDDPESWSVPSIGNGNNRVDNPKHKKTAVYHDPDEYTEPLIASDEPYPLIQVANSSAKDASDEDKGASWRAVDAPDSEFKDGKFADEAVQALGELQKKHQPFFLAVGFLKPHLSFVAPKKFFDLYSLDEMPLASNPDPPKDYPIPCYTGGELRKHTDIPKKGPLPEDLQRLVIRGYYAAASFADSQVGRVLAELDRLGLRDSTIIVLWGDHGWQLGEHGCWDKHTNFEVATRAPLIFSYPGQTTRGTKTDVLTEFVDIYPTLCDLAGLPLPGGLEGHSLMFALKDPNQQWARAAYSQWPAYDANRTMGYTMRTDRYRYTEWGENGKVGIELYDHQTDPGENINLTPHADKKLLETLSKALHDAGRSDLPRELIPATKKS